MMILRTFILAWALAVLAGCASPPRQGPSIPGDAAAVQTGRGTEVALFAMSLIDTGYRFGGKNPEAGVDCSGMVSYVFDRAAGLRITGSAAQMAKLGRPVAFDQVAAGDLVFFNTRNAPRSHVGIYVGEGKFVHAPSNRGRVKVSSLREAYFAARFEEARRYLD